jgi:hypothetical protein
MSEPRPTRRPEYFDTLYAADPDPWKFAASPYERAKYAHSARGTERECFVLRSDRGTLVKLS